MAKVVAQMAWRQLVAGAASAVHAVDAPLHGPVLAAGPLRPYKAAGLLTGATHRPSRSHVSSDLLAQKKGDSIDEPPGVFRTIIGLGLTL